MRSPSAKTSSGRPEALLVAVLVVVMALPPEPVGLGGLTRPSPHLYEGHNHRQAGALPLCARARLCGRLERLKGLGSLRAIADLACVAGPSTGVVLHAHEPPIGDTVGLRRTTTSDRCADQGARLPLPEWSAIPPGVSAVGTISVPTAVISMSCHARLSATAKHPMITKER